MTEQDRRYCMSERKVLAAVLALRRLRLYPFPEKLSVVYMEQKTLETAFQLVDIHGRLFRWIELMAEYDLEVIYMPKADNFEVDYL